MDRVGLDMNSTVFSHPGTTSTLLCAWSAYRILTQRKNGKDKMPHFPALPLVGSFAYMPLDASPDFLSEQADKYGDVYDLYFGSQ